MIFVAAIETIKEWVNPALNQRQSSFSYFGRFIQYAYFAVGNFIYQDYTFDTNIIITTRIRRMMEGNALTLSIAGEGISHPAW